MKAGFGAPICILRTPEGATIGVKVRKMHYVYNDGEEGVDNSIVEIESINPSVVDIPELQVNQELLLQWGYIGGAFSAKRILYVEDRDENFGETGIVVSLKLAPLAKKLKQVKSQEVYAGGTEEVLDKIRSKYGLEKPTEDTEEETRANTYNPGGLDRRRSYLKEDGTQSAAKDNVAVVKPFDRIYETLPGGNKTVLQTVQELAQEKPGGPHTVVARDNTLGVKKMELSQKPSWAWHYKHENGHVISFMYSSNNQNNMAMATNQEFGLWDPETKTYIRSQVNASTSNNTRLATEEVSIPQPTTNQSVGTPTDLIDPLLDTRPREPRNVTVLPFTFDSTKKLYTANGILGVAELNTYKQGYLKEDGSFTQATESTAVVGGGLITVELPISIVNGQTGSPEDVANAAANSRDQKAMDTNKATLVVVGLPHIVAGKVINIYGVGVKNSGAWFVSIATHELSANNEYTLRMELSRGQMNTEEKTVGDPSKDAKLTNEQVAATMNQLESELKTLQQTWE